MPWPPVVPQASRGNSTPQVNTHPTDHNTISTALTDIVFKIDHLDTSHDHFGIYAPTGHDHAGVYSPVAHTHVGLEPGPHSHSEYSLTAHTHSGYSTTSHNHDSSYSATGHTHAGYASSTHNHDATYALIEHDSSHYGNFWGLWTGNQAAYDALGAWSDNVLYVIV